MDDRVLDLCCGGKNCPVWRELDDGNFSVEDGATCVQMDRAQAARAAAWLISRLHADVEDGLTRDLHDDGPW
jgi:hypothetical protein